MYDFDRSELQRLTQEELVDMVLELQEALLRTEDELEVYSQEIQDLEYTFSEESPFF